MNYEKKLKIFNLIGSRQPEQEHAAEYFPYEYLFVKEIRRQLYKNRVVIALNSKGEFGYVHDCYVCNVQSPPYWYATVMIVPKYYSLPWNVRDCEFYYIGKNGKIKTIKEKVDKKIDGVYIEGVKEG